MDDHADQASFFRVTRSRPSVCTGLNRFGHVYWVSNGHGRTANRISHLVSARSDDLRLYCTVELLIGLMGYFTRYVPSLASRSLLGTRVHTSSTANCLDAERE